MIRAALVLAVLAVACGGASTEEPSPAPDEVNACGWPYAGAVEVPSGAACFEVMAAGGVSLEFRVRGQPGCWAMSLEECRPECGALPLVQPGALIDVWGEADPSEVVTFAPHAAEDCS